MISWPFLLDWHVLYNASGSAVLAAGVLIHSCVHHDRRGVVCYAVLCCTVSHGGHWRLHGWCATTRLVGVSVIQADCIVGMLACWSVSFSQMPTERACRRAFMCATVVAVLEGCDRMVVLTACALASISTRVCVCVCVCVCVSWCGLTSCECVHPQQLGGGRQRQLDYVIQFGAVGLLSLLFGVLLCNVNYLVDPASSHMLVSKIKPCMSQCRPSYGETANGSLNQLWFIGSYPLNG